MPFSPWLCDYWELEAYCRNCGARIVWMKTEKGKNIPLDPGWIRRISDGEALGMTLYVASTEEEGVAVVSAGPYERAGGYTCHIATCASQCGDDRSSPDRGSEPV